MGKYNVLILIKMKDKSDPSHNSPVISSSRYGLLSLEYAKSIEPPVRTSKGTVPFPGAPLEPKREIAFSIWVKSMIHTYLIRPARD